jgi:N-acetylmuramoyl-L-alanine amidase
MEAMPEAKKAAPARRRRRRVRPSRPPRRWWPFVCGALLGGALVWMVLGRVGGALNVIVRPTAGRPALDPLTTPPQQYDWLLHPDAEFPIPPYAQHLRNVKIVLDPGHVGQKDRGRGWKRGPTGLREAEVNRRVALSLEEFLKAVGADVVLTRREDRELGLTDAEDLRARAALANQRRADLLLSIHHNAGPPSANHTLVYYHGALDQGHASLAAGRHLLTGLQDALRLKTHPPCALLSDYADEDNGFMVLREAQVPAVLTEASFHSNPQEEERLRDPVYNRREAYGLFIGLARWAQAGLPRAIVKQANGPELILALDDGLGGRADEIEAILSDTITVRMGERALPFTFNAKKRELRVRRPDGVRGRQILFVDFQNIFGQPVLHPNLTIELAG